MIRKSLTILLAVLAFISCSQSDEQKKMEIAGRLRDINELQLEELTLSKTYTVRDKFFENQEKGYRNIFEELGDWLKHKTRVGARIGVYSIKRNYSAYIDLNELRPDDISFEDDMLQVVLPEVRIKVLGNEMVPEAIHERVTGLRWQITENERNAMKARAAHQLDSIMSTEIDPMVSEMKQRAERKAQAWIMSILADRGYIPSVSFRK